MTKEEMAIDKRTGRATTGGSEEGTKSTITSGDRTDHKSEATSKGTMGQGTHAIQGDFSNHEMGNFH